MAVSITPLLGFAALSVDIGIQRLTVSQMQVACDSAALGSVGYLNGTERGMNHATERAVWLARQNFVLGGWQLSRGDVAIGVEEEDGFVEVGEDRAADANAVRVNGQGTVNSILAGYAFGLHQLNAGATSTAARPGGSGPAQESPCYLPFALPDCLFPDRSPTSNPPPMEFRFSNANEDNLGWGMPIANIGSRRIRDRLEGQCDFETLEVGATLWKDNGQKNSAVKAIRDIINGKGKVDASNGPSDLFTWPPRRDGRTANKSKDSDIKGSSYGDVIEGVVPLVDMGDDCDNLNFRRGRTTITGFTYGYVFDVRAKGKNKNLWIQFDFINEYDVGQAGDPNGRGNVMGDGGGATRIIE
jgi:hypothetical protein